MGKSVPQISVAMPCYNHEEYVGEAIESVLNQTYKEFEFVVLDNGSTDNSRNVILNYQDKIDKVLLSDINKILCGGDLVKSCSGEYIAFMCSDDYWYPEKLEKQVAAMEKYGIDTCFTWGVYTDNNLNPRTGPDGDFFKIDNRTRGEWFHLFWEEGNCLAYPSGIMKREKYLELWNRARRFRQLGDWYLWLNVLLHEEIYVVPEVLVKLRRTGKNVSEVRLDSSIRSASEYTYITMETIEKMDDETLIQAFKQDFVNKEAKTKTELTCEKIMLMMNKAKTNKVYEPIAILYFFNHCKDFEVSEMLEEKYNFSMCDLWDYYSDAGIGKWYASLVTIDNNYQELKKQFIHMIQYGKFNKELLNSEMVSLGEMVVNYYNTLEIFISSTEKKPASTDLVIASLKEIIIPISLVSNYFKIYGCTAKVTECAYIINQMHNIDSNDKALEIIKYAYESFADLNLFLSKVL